MRSLTSNHLAALGMAAALVLGDPVAAREALGQEAPSQASSPKAFGPAVTGSPSLDAGQAAAWSFLVPGSGQIMAGEPVRGGLFLAAATGLSGLAVAGFFTKSHALLQTAGAGLVFLSLVAPLDAYLLVRDRNSGQEGTRRRSRGTINQI